MTPTESTGVELRRAREDEADAIADLYTLVRLANEPAIPPAVHTPEENRVVGRQPAVPRPRGVGGR